MRYLAIIIVCLAAACQSPAQPSGDGPTQKRADPGAQPIDPRTQYGLVDAILAAQADDDADDRRMAKIVSDWQGRRYRWELRVVPALCPTRTRCHVFGFDHMRFDQPVVQGWLPRLELSEAQHVALLRACRDESPCVATVEATLDTLTLSWDDPTALSLAHVQVKSARTAAPDESWVRRRRSSQMNAALSRTAETRSLDRSPSSEASALSSRDAPR